MKQTFKKKTHKQWFPKKKRGRKRHGAKRLIGDVAGKRTGHPWAAPAT